MADYLLNWCQVISTE